MSLDGLRVDQIGLAGYESHPPIRGEVAV
jgi:hypothetical protein